MTCSIMEWLWVAHFDRMQREKRDLPTDLRIIYRKNIDFFCVYSYEESLIIYTSCMQPRILNCLVKQLERL